MLLSFVTAAGVGVRILAGISTGAVAVLAAQPTDVVKVRMQAAKAGEARYSGSLAAYKSIARHEGIRGLWKGTKFIYLFVCYYRIS